MDNPLQFFQLNQKRDALLLLLAAGLVLMGGSFFLQFAIERHHTAPLLLLYGILFAAYGLLAINRKHFTILSILLIGILVRVVLFFSLPSLSDDFYRFLWDGHLQLHGYHPFAQVPQWYWENSNLLTDPYLYELFGKMNSPEYFTIYPPITQWLFLLAAKWGGTNLLLSVNILRGVYLLAEIIAWFQLLRLLGWFGRSKKHILLLVLNPLVFLEGVGNLHPELLLLPFLFLLIEGVVLIGKKQHRALSLLSIGFAGAVAVKLWPLLFGPYLFFKLGWKRGLVWVGVSTFLLTILFLPFLNEVLTNGYTQSLSLYFQHFEFNASLYYLVRWVGTLLVGYNPIATVAPVLSLLSATIIVVLSWFAYRQNWHVAAAFSILYAVFLVGSAIVHPWYVLPLVALALFMNQRAAIAWSALILLTYAGYTVTGYQEMLSLVALEYGLVLAYLIFVDKNYTLKNSRRYLRKPLSNYGKNVL